MSDPLPTPAIAQRAADGQQTGKTIFVGATALIDTDHDIDHPDAWRSWSTSVVLTHYPEDELGDDAILGTAEIASLGGTHVGLYGPRAFLDICDELGDDLAHISGTIEFGRDDLEQATTVITSVLHINNIEVHPEADRNHWATVAIHQTIAAVAAHDTSVLVTLLASPDAELPPLAGFTHWQDGLWIRHTTFQADEPSREQPEDFTPLRLVDPI